MEFTFQDYRIHYVDEGQGDPVLLLNGVYMTTRSWDGVVDAFTQQYRLIRMDFIDQGLSQWVDKAYDIDLQAEIVLALLDHLGIEKVSLVATSYGSVVAQQVASSRPELVSKMVISNAAAHFPISFHQSILSLSTVFDSMAWLQPRMFGALTRITRSIDGVDVRPELSKITCPTLVVSSEFDNLTPKYLQLEILSLIPDSQYAVIMGAGHVVVYEKPHEFTRVALGFLAH
ncbi:MAG: alpha/beta hydrolase [Propionibacteriaceae bacterium]|nr:alpha/beta hydrolase [Propionibacteriaceae bacterium]